MKKYYKLIVDNKVLDKAYFDYDKATTDLLLNEVNNKDILEIAIGSKSIVIQRVSGLPITPELALTLEKILRGR